MIQNTSMLWGETVPAEGNKHQGGSAAEWFMKGQQAWSSGNYDEAMNCYQHTIALDLSFTNAYSFLGNVYMEKILPFTTKNPFPL